MCFIKYFYIFLIDSSDIDAESEEIFDFFQRKRSTYISELVFSYIANFLANIGLFKLMKFSNRQIQI